MVMSQPKRHLLQLIAPHCAGSFIILFCTIGIYTSDEAADLPNNGLCTVVYARWTFC